MRKNDKKGAAKKLPLSRQTLRALETLQLLQVAGGGVSGLPNSGCPSVPRLGALRRRRH